MKLWLKAPCGNEKESVIFLPLVLTLTRWGKKNFFRVARSAKNIFFSFSFYTSVLFLQLLWFFSRTKLLYASVKCFLAELCSQFNQNAFRLNKIIDPRPSAACAAGTTCWPSRPPCQILTHSQLSCLLSESHGLLLSLPQRLTQDAARRAAVHMLAQSARPQTSALSFYGKSTKCYIHY